MELEELENQMKKKIDGLAKNQPILIELNV